MRQSGCGTQIFLVSSYETSSLLIGISHVGHNLPTAIRLLFPHSHVFTRHGNGFTFAALARELPGTNGVPEVARGANIRLDRLPFQGDLRVPSLAQTFAHGGFVEGNRASRREIGRVFGKE